jgi:uncharacterized repeat protein (TIGR01451 family)
MAAAVVLKSVTSRAPLRYVGLIPVYKLALLVTSRPLAGSIWMLLFLGGTLRLHGAGGAPVTDNFNSSTLNTSLWTFVNPVGNGSFSMTGTNLLLSVPAGSNHDPSFGSTDNAVRVVQAIGNVNVDVTVKFDSIPTLQYQFQGMLVEQDSQNYLRFQFGSTGSSLIANASKILSGNETGVLGASISLPAGTKSLWLRVQRSANLWTQSWSPDGSTFHSIGSFNQALTVVDLGPFAGNYNANSAPAFAASIDYFLSGTGPDLTLAKSHTGGFTQGQTGAAYTLTANNIGTGATSGMVTVTDTLPTGLTATAIGGTGWTCTLASLNCTRSDSLAAGGSYPAITLTVNVAGNAPASVTNTAAVAGGGETNTSNDTASDPTTITAPATPDLTLTKSHTGNFTQGQTGAAYTLTAKNIGTGATTGTVTVTDTPPTGLTATAIGGTGWVCTLTSLNCTRSDTLGAGSSYPAITLTVNVAGNAPASVTNTGGVAGGGETNTANDSASDPTTITAPATPDLTLTKSHTGNFTQGQTGAAYTLTAKNIGTGATSGMVTVTDTLPTGLTATAIGGTGWVCTLTPLNCTRSDTLGAGSSYPAITLTVNVAGNAPASVTNTGSVAGGGETNTANDSASDPTTITAPPTPDLTLTKSHTGNFTQGQTGPAYTLTVKNSGTGATSGTVTVTDKLPTGLTATAMGGTGWTCTLASLNCTRSDNLAAGSSYPAITLTVNVAGNAPASVTNTCGVAGGGETNTANNSASDPTTIIAPAGGAPVTDSFNSSTLNTSLWTFVNPVGNGSFSMTGTNLLLSVPAGSNHDPSFGGTDNAVRVMQTIGNVDLDVTVKFDSIPTLQYQFQGMLVEQDSQNYFRFQFASTGSSLIANASTILARNENGVLGATISPPAGTTSLWLRVQRSGNLWTQSWSSDGTTFHSIGSFTQALTVVDLGPFAGNYNANSAPAFAASIDYFLSGTGPDLTLTKSHTGSFTQGQTGGSYTLTANNIGTGATSGMVTVTDTLPTGLTATAIGGTGWTCTLASLNCTRSDSLAAGGSYPVISVTVNVAGNAPASVTNTAAVAGGGETNTSNDTASDVTTITAPATPDLTLTKSHTGNFTLGQTGAAYTLTAKNIGTGATSGMVTVTDTLPTGLTATAMGGTGWVCTLASLNCTRSDTLAGGGSYPAITLTVNVADNAPANVTNTGNVAGGGETNTANDSASDPTAIAAPTGGGPTSDNFDASILNTTLWTFINPLGDGSFSLNGSNLLLFVPQAAQHDAGSAGDQTVRVMQSISNVDFEVEVRFQTAVMFAFQRQGVIVEQDSNTYLRFDITNDGTTPRLSAYSFVSGSPTAQVDIPIASSGPPFWLRVKRFGNSWIESYSIDGVTFTSAASFSFGMNVNGIGPFAGNSGSALPAFAASVDYFFNTASKVSNLDGPLTFQRVVIDPNPPPTLLEKVLADIDGDGRLDAVIGFGNPPNTSTGMGIAWYEFPHSGIPTDPWLKHIILASGSMYEDATALDVNGDGAIDIIASFDGGEIDWFENPRGHGGNPATAPWIRHFIGNGSGENNMAVADIDGDGKLDLVTNAFVFFQNSPTSWSPVKLNRTSNGMALLDIGSGLGAINIVGMGNAPSFPFIWLENPREKGGNARTDPWIVHVIGPGYDNNGEFTTFAAADVNGDGRMDVITAISEPTTPTPAPIYWWEAPADRRNGSWIPHIVSPAYLDVHNVRTADMDGNGTADIIVGEQEQSTLRRVAVFYNDGQGNFTQQILSSGSGHNQVVGDTLKRGALDILNAPHGYSGALHPVELYLNQSKPIR